MAKNIYQRAYWAFGADPDEFDSLEQVLKREISSHARSSISGLFSDYSLARASAQDGISPAAFRAHMKKVAAKTKAAADILDQPDFHSYDAYGSSALSRPKNRLPRSKMENEAYLAIRTQLMHWDADYARSSKDKGFQVDPKLRNIDLVFTAWALTRIGEAAASIAGGLVASKPGRPDGGASAFVAGLIAILEFEGISIKCRFDSATGDYIGNFREIAAWLSTLRKPIAEQEGVLCRYAVDVLSARRKTAGQRKKSSR